MRRVIPITASGCGRDDLVLILARSSFAQSAPQIDWNKIDSEALDYLPHLSALRYDQSAEQHRRRDRVSQVDSRQGGNRHRNFREQARDGDARRANPRARGHEAAAVDVACRRCARGRSQLDASSVRRRYQGRLRVGARRDRQQGARDYGADDDARAQAQSRRAAARRRDDGESGRGSGRRQRRDVDGEQSLGRDRSRVRIQRGR